MLLRATLILATLGLILMACAPSEPTEPGMRAVGRWQFEAYGVPGPPADLRLSGGRGESIWFFTPRPRDQAEAPSIGRALFEHYGDAMAEEGWELRDQIEPGDEGVWTALWEREGDLARLSYGTTSPADEWVQLTIEICPPLVPGRCLYASDPAGPATD